MDKKVVQMLFVAREDPHRDVDGKTVLDVALEKKIRAYPIPASAKAKESTEDTKSSD